MFCLFTFSFHCMFSQCHIWIYIFHSSFYDNFFIQSFLSGFTQLETSSSRFNINILRLFLNPASDLSFCSITSATVWHLLPPLHLNVMLQLNILLFFHSLSVHLICFQSTSSLSLCMPAPKNSFGIRPSFRFSSTPFCLRYICVYTLSLDSPRFWVSLLLVIKHPKDFSMPKLDGGELHPFVSLSGLSAVTLDTPSVGSLL